MSFDKLDSDNNELYRIEDILPDEEKIDQALTKQRLAIPKPYERRKEHIRKANNEADRRLARLDRI